MFGREIKNELDLDINIEKPSISVINNYGTFKINLFIYLVIKNNSTIKLAEHNSYEWVSPCNLLYYNLTPADIPIVHEIQLIWNSESMNL